MSYRKELKAFKEFKKNYHFNQLELIYENDKIYCEQLLVKDESGYIGISEKWINVGYNISGTYPKLLSNLFPYKFKFQGYYLNSLESFFQAIKFKETKLQKKIFKYSGKEALVLKEATNFDWSIEGYIYFKGKKIKRTSQEYDDLIDKLYISAIQNSFYRNVIKKCPLPIIHVLGKTNKNETVFTRYEFEYMLNCLHAFLNR